MITYHGQVAQDGMAAGVVFLMKKKNIDAPTEGTIDAQAELKKYHDAKATVSNDIDKLYEQAVKDVGQESAEIIRVQKMILNDADFEKKIEGLINNKNKSAVQAVRETGMHFHDLFAGIDDVYMQARSSDIDDLARHLCGIISGETRDIKLLAPAIIVADDLLPSEFLGMGKDKILGIVTRKGSVSSHVAILAKTAGIPAIMQANILLDNIKDGEEILVDAYDNKIYLQSDEKTKKKFLEKKAKMKSKMKALDDLKGVVTKTKSGNRINLYANIGNVSDAKMSLENDAEGIGLLRSEFLYLEGDDYPSEEAQFEAYKAVAKVMGDKKVVIRTMDIGVDKKADYFQLEDEENPALGYRAIRICFDRPKIFKTQLRAILRASMYGNVSVMFPMITSLAEVNECKRFLAEAKTEVLANGGQCKDVEMGIMIETPAAAAMADILAKEVDFFSVGTNDLQQYVFAVDWKNDRVEHIVDKKHPGLLKLLKMIADGAAAAGIKVGICGDLAADIEMTETFLQMGYTEISVPPMHVLKLRKKIIDIE